MMKTFSGPQECQILKEYLWQDMNNYNKWTFWEGKNYTLVLFILLWEDESRKALGRCHESCRPRDYSYNLEPKRVSLAQRRAWHKWRSGEVYRHRPWSTLSSPLRVCSLWYLPWVQILQKLQLFFKLVTIMVVILEVIARHKLMRLGGWDTLPPHSLYFQVEEFL